MARVRHRHHRTRDGSRRAGGAAGHTHTHAHTHGGGASAERRHIAAVGVGPLLRISLGGLLLLSCGRRRCGGAFAFTVPLRPRPPHAPSPPIIAATATTTTHPAPPRVLPLGRSCPDGDGAASWIGWRAAAASTGTMQRLRRRLVLRRRRGNSFATSKLDATSATSADVDDYVDTFFLPDDDDTDDPPSTPDPPPGITASTTSTATKVGPLMRLRSTIRRATGFSLTKMRSTIRGLTGFSMTTMRATLRAATGVSISGMLRRMMGIFPIWFRCLFQPFLILYYWPIFVARGLVGFSKSYRSEKRAAHETLVDGWTKAVRTAERANEGGYWPIRVTEEGGLTFVLPPEAGDDLLEGEFLEFVDDVDVDVAVNGGDASAVMAPAEEGIEAAASSVAGVADGGLEKAHGGVGASSKEPTAKSDAVRAETPSTTTTNVAEANAAVLTPDAAVSLDTVVEAVVDSVEESLVLSEEAPTIGEAVPEEVAAKTEEDDSSSISTDHASAVVAAEERGQPSAAIAVEEGAAAPAMTTKAVAAVTAAEVEAAPATTEAVAADIAQAAPPVSSAAAAADATETAATPEGPRWAVASDQTNLTGKWYLINSDEFKSGYDAFLQSLGQPAIVRAVALTIVGFTREETTQEDGGRRLVIRGTNPRGAWERTLESSGADIGKPDFEPINVTVTSADAELVQVESWWENEGTVHKSWMRGGQKYGGGDFESSRYLEGDDVLVCESTFHPRDQSRNTSSMVWRFNRESVREGMMGLTFD